MTALYRMADAPDADKAAILCASEEEALSWNTPARGHGVFWTVNDFAGARRRANLTRIRAWAIDMDAGTKAEQAAKIHRSPLIPSLVVETKRGYQVYWSAADGAKPEHWNALMLERLVPFFGADKNARDLCRILRVPGFLHLKDAADPFLCRVVWEHKVRYTERQLADAFPWVCDRQAHAAALEEARRSEAAELREAQRREAVAAGCSPSETLWEAIYRLDARETLARLSGSHWVNSEEYSFQRTSRGRWNIYVGKKGTSCFIDEAGHIGSFSGGGPTPASWLRWLGKSWKECIQALKEVHPHLVEVDEAARRSRRAA